VVTFQGEGLVEGPGCVLQLSVLGGGQQVGVGVWLNGRRRGLALLHREEGPAGLGAGDSPLVAVGGRGSERLGGGAVEEQLMLRCDWMPAVGLLQVQLLLFPPNVVQQDVAVRRPPAPLLPAPLPSKPLPPAPLRWAGGGVLGAGGWRMEGEGLEGLKSLWQVSPERDKGHHHGGSHDHLVGGGGDGPGIYSSFTQNYISHINESMMRDHIPLNRSHSYK